MPTLPLNFSTGGLRVSTIYQAGVQLNLPLRNRTAQADAARDSVQVRQVQARTEKLADQIRVDIENAEIAVETSYAAYKAAEASRGYQEQLLQATPRPGRVRAVDESGTSCRTRPSWRRRSRPRLRRESNWKKAQIELDRSLGDLLEKNGISLDDAVQGQVKP